MLTFSPLFHRVLRLFSMWPYFACSLPGGQNSMTFSTGEQNFLSFAEDHMCKMSLSFSQKDRFMAEMKKLKRLIKLHNSDLVLTAPDFKLGVSFGPIWNSRNRKAGPQGLYTLRRKPPRHTYQKCIFTTHKI